MIGRRSFTALPLMLCPTLRFGLRRYCSLRLCVAAIRSSQLASSKSMIEQILEFIICAVIVTRS